MCWFGGWGGIRHLIVVRAYSWRAWGTEPGLAACKATSLPSGLSLTCSSGLQGSFCVKEGLLVASVVFFFFESWDFEVGKGQKNFHPDF